MAFLKLEFLLLVEAWLGLVPSLVLALISGQTMLQPDLMQATATEQSKQQFQPKLVAITEQSM